MMGHNICFKGVIRKIIPFTSSYLEYCAMSKNKICAQFALTVIETCIIQKALHIMGFCQFYKGKEFAGTVCFQD